MKTSLDKILLVLCTIVMIYGMLAVTMSYTKGDIKEMILWSFLSLCANILAGRLERNGC